MALTVQEAKNAIQALIDHQKTTGETVFLVPNVHVGNAYSK